MTGRKRKQALEFGEAYPRHLEKDGAAVITPTDTADTEKIFAQTRFNGDGIIPPEAAGDPELAQIITTIMDCCGSDMDRSGQPGIAQEKVDTFYTDLGIRRLV